MNNKAHLRPKDFDSNGDIIPMACKEEKEYLISREALKKATTSFTDCDGFNPVWQIIDNAPTISDRYAEGYQTGFEEAKVIIHSIAEQYTAHNELVPIWLSIGDIKGGNNNDVR